MAEVLSTGEEILSGQVVDTNASYIARRLSAQGWVVSALRVVGDGEEEIAGALEAAVGRSSLIVLSGGLGPTRDDRSREALARVAGMPLVRDPRQVTRLTALFASRGRSIPKSNLRQTLLPDGANSIDNSCGTAPGIDMSIRGTRVLLLPGVPTEMRAMLAGIDLCLASEPLVSVTLDIVGISEARVDERAAAVELPEGVRLGTVASEDRISLRLSGFHAAALEKAAGDLEVAFGPHFLGKTGESPAQIVVKVASQQKKNIATAESCTGGMIGASLTEVPGSSNAYRGGVVAYSDEAKREILGVDPELLEEHGAVSRPVAISMAEGARRIFGTSFGLSVTGIAGPGGATPAKPVGLVFLALASEQGTRGIRRVLVGDRQRVRRSASQIGLELLRRRLLGLSEIREG